MLSGGALFRPEFVGREVELERLMQALDEAVGGKGSTVFVEGNAGVGKSRLVGAFRDVVADRNVNLLSGSGDSSSVQPFFVWSRALEDVVDGPLFEEQEFTRFVKIFAVNEAGLLVAQAVSEEGDMDSDIFAGMLSAVQSFVKDSLGQDSEEGAGLGRLEFGDLKILIEHGKHLFLTGVSAGAEHPDMRVSLRRTLHRIEEEYGGILSKSSVNEVEVEPVQKVVANLAETEFLVKRDLEGVKLENERIRIADRVLNILKEMTVEKTVVLLLEDLHWVDESTLFVLQYLARNIKNSPILLVGTYRPEESQGLEVARDKMEGEGTLERIVLGDLTIEDTRVLVDDLFSPNAFPVTMLEKLYHRSRGNPLFVIELLRSMQDQNSICLEDGKFTLVSEDFHVPATVEEVVNYRLEMLDMDSLAMAEYVSCIGQSFDIALAASNQLLEDTSKSLEKLLSFGILLKEGDKIEFSHAVFQDVIYNSIGERWKLGYHKNIGEHLEKTYGDGIDQAIYDLARHFSKTKEYNKTAEYCTRAGEKAETSFAVEQALKFYENALGAMSKLDAVYWARGVLGIKEKIGNMLFIIGDYDEAIHIFKEIQEISEDIETKARMHRKAAQANLDRGNIDISIESTELGKNLLEENTAEYGRLLYTQGYGYLRKGDYENAMSILLEAIKIFSSTEAEQRDFGNALRAVGNIHNEKGEYESALQYYAKSLSIMEESGDNRGVGMALNNIGLTYLELGRLDVALTHLQRALAVREKMGDKIGIGYVLTNIGWTHLELGEFREALPYLQRSLKICEEIGDNVGEGYALIDIGFANIELGMLDDAMEYLQRGLTVCEGTGDTRGIGYALNNIGWVNMESGMLDDALSYLQKSLSACEKIGDKRGAALALSNIGQAYLDFGMLDDALLAVEKGVNLSLEIGVRMKEGRNRRILGAVLHNKGDLDRALGEFENAVRIFEDVRALSELAKCYYGRALLRIEMGFRAEACEDLDMALGMFEDIGMKLWAEKCLEAINDVGVRH